MTEAALAAIMAGISTAGSIGSSYLQAGMNKRQMRYARELAERGLTQSDLQAFELNRQSAQEARDFALEMDSTNYQRKVADMQAAGVNPALAIGGVQSAPSSNAMANASSSGYGSGLAVQAPDLSAVASIASLGLENKRLNQEYKLRDRQLDIEKQNADTAAKNADSQSRQAGAAERQAGVAERNATVAETRANIERDLADSNIQVNNKRIDEMTANISHINKVVDQMDDYLEIAKKNANSAAIQAAAAMKAANAALQNAVTNSYVADYQTDLYYTNSVLNGLIADEKSEVLKLLPDKLQVEIANMRKEGVLLDKRGQWIDKNGKLMDAQRIKTYVETGVEVTNVVANIVTGVTPVSKIGFK